jgi:hypothetical protein
MMRNLSFSLLFLTLISFQGAFADDFPKGPIEQITPGALCDQPTSHRYPEQIAYCDRDVDSMTKNAVIADYDRRFGFRIEQMQRSQFKIDHYIPLCMGGANSSANLWPQHVTVYQITDPLEPLLCQKMSEGRLKQKDAVDMIKQAKNNLSMVGEIMRRAQAL